jgi:hypothetical protein
MITCFTQKIYSDEAKPHKPLDARPVPILDDAELKTNPERPARAGHDRRKMNGAAHRDATGGRAERVGGEAAQLRPAFDTDHDGRERVIVGSSRRIRSQAAEARTG